jgi:transposase
MTFKNYQQKQSFLLPPNFADFLGEAHEAVILSEFLNELNTIELEQSYNNQNGGRAAYHPVMLLSILIYGYMNGVFSSRQLAKQLKQNLAFMYLAGNVTPDFRTLARFRKEKSSQLENVFVSVVQKAKDLGFVNFGTCCLDGTKIYASASPSKNKTQKKLSEKIRSLIDEAEKIDQTEDDIYGDSEDGENTELKTKAGRDKKKHELEEKKRQAKKELTKLNALNPATKDTRVNLTDPDSKLMQMKRKDFANGYNVQCITENGIILSNSIFNGSSDTDTLIPSLHKLQNRFTLPKKLLADKGYSSAGNYSFCEQNFIDAYIPIHCQQVDISSYIYDETKDEYTDAEGRKYHFKQHEQRKDGNRKRGRPHKSKESSNQRHHLFKSTIYENLNETTGKKKYLSISLDWQTHIKKQKEKLSTLKGKLIYKQRMHDVEGVFANIKKNLRFDSFNLRGFSGVSTEWMLISLAHNLKKIL